MKKNEFSGSIYKEIFRRLEKKKIKYLVIGGVAVNLHGFPRSTGDLDIMLQMDGKNLLKFAKVMEELGFKPKVPVRSADFAEPDNLKKWKKEKNMLVFSFIHPDNPCLMMDVLTENQIDFETAYKNRSKGNAWGIKINIASIDDLIELKKKAGRPIDISDIDILRKLKRKQ